MFVQDMFQIVLRHSTTFEKALMSINIERPIGIKTIRTEKKKQKIQSFESNGGFSVIQIIREIIFGDSRSSKMSFLQIYVL